MKLRGYLALIVTCTGLLLFDPVQRLLIAPYLRLRPSRRIATMTAWIRWMAAFLRRCMNFIGGSRIPTPPTIAGNVEDGVLLVMNHQSLFDIPLIVSAVTGVYPRIVTRRRYATRIPLISHLIRLYQYPIVDPAATREEIANSVKQLAEIARTTDVPLAIFPEGTRTKDGEIARFKTKGLKAILATRPWTVYAYVVDGFWERAKFKDFLGGVGDLDGKMEFVGRFEWSDPEGDALPFIQGIRDQMVDRLQAMRDKPSA